jgi:hypothetical protein
MARHFRFWHLSDKPAATAHVCFRKQLGPSVIDRVRLISDLGGVKALEAVARGQQKKRTCRLGESFMRELRSV